MFPIIIIYVPGFYGDVEIVPHVVRILGRQREEIIMLASFAGFHGAWYSLIHRLSWGLVQPHSQALMGPGTASFAGFHGAWYSLIPRLSWGLVQPHSQAFMGPGTASFPGSHGAWYTMPVHVKFPW